MDDANRVTTQLQLDVINARIDAHALNTAQMKAAREVTAEFRDGGTDAVQKALTGACPARRCKAKRSCSAWPRWRG